MTELPISSGDDDLKRKYALLCFTRPDTDVARFDAALLLFPLRSQVALALEVAQSWPHDPVCLAERDRLAKTDALADSLPTAVEAAQAVWNLANDTTKGVDDRLKAHKLYAEIRGFIAKPGAGFGSVTINNNRVMLMPAPQAPDDWERGAISQQMKLVSDARQPDKH